MTDSTGSIGLGGALRLLIRQFAPNRRALTIVILISLLETGLSAQISLSFKYLIDTAITQKSGRVLALLTISLAISILVVGIAGIWRDRIYGGAAAELAANMRIRMFEHLQKLSAGFYSRMDSADIASRFSNDLGEVEAAFLSGVPYAILPALEILMSIVLIFLLDWRLALPALLAFPLAMAGPRWLTVKTSLAAYERKRHEARFIANIQENVSANALVRAFNLQKSARVYFIGHNKALEMIVARLGFLTLLMERSASFSTQLLQVAVLGIGGYLTFRGEMTIGTLAAFQALFATLAESLGYIAEYLPEIVRASGGMLRIEELLAERPEVVDSTDARQLPPFREAIEFKDVEFGYEENERNLRGLSLKIPRANTVALVGPSGSGKSTILTLLMRFYDPTAGTVFIDGHDLRSVTQESIRAKTSIVFQENFLFSASVVENIRIARPDATDEEVENAASQAGLDQFIRKLPQGYNTITGWGDGRFPAGQRQRLAIARALLRNPDILVLDEATSGLDSSSEAMINETINNAATGRTVITVTHRLASVIHANRIFFVDQGRVVEEGTHADLLAKDSAYARMWKKQSGFVLTGDSNQVRVTPDWLRSVPLLAQVEEDILIDLSRMFVTERSSRDQFVIHEGDAGDKFYILVRGSVEILKSLPSGFHRVAVFQDGDYFGETSMILDAPRNASVRTLADCTFLVLTRDRFLSLMERAPSLRAKMLEQQRLREQASPQAQPNANPTAPQEAATEKRRPHLLLAGCGDCAKDLPVGEYNLDFAANLNDVWEAIENARVDLVVLDAATPGESGVTALTDLLTRDVPAAASILLLAEAADSPLIAEAVAKGLEDFLIKPLNPLLFRAKVEACLRRRSRSR